MVGEEEEEEEKVVVVLLVKIERNPLNTQHAQHRPKPRTDEIILRLMLEPVIDYCARGRSISTT